MEIFGHWSFNGAVQEPCPGRMFPQTAAEDHMEYCLILKYLDISKCRYLHGGIHAPAS